MHTFLFLTEKNPEAIGALVGGCGKFNAAIDFTGYTTSLFRLLAASDMVSKTGFRIRTNLSKFALLLVNHMCSVS